MGPKPSGGSTYPGGGVTNYQTPSGTGYSYEDMAAVAAAAAGGPPDFSKVYGALPGGGLGKTSGMPSTSAEMSSGSYKHQPFDSSKTGGSYSPYNVPQGGYGFIHGVSLVWCLVGLCSTE